MSFFIFKELKADPHDYEWFIVGPLLLLYVAYVWEIRSKVDIQDRRKLTGKTLAYWIAFGILLFANYSSPIPANDYLSINLFFVIFTLLLADSYWDFRAITMRSVTSKSER